MNPLKKLASQTAVYGLSSMIGRALNYLLVPYYTSVFVPGEYGVINELYAYVAFFNVLFTFGLETTYFRFANNKESYSEKEVYNSTQTLVMLFSIIGGAGLIFMSQPLANLIDFPDKSNFVTWLAIVIVIDALVAVPFARIRYQNKAKTYAGVRLLNVGVNLGLNLFFITLCKPISEGKMLPGMSWLGDLYDPNIGVGYVFISNLIANALYLPMLYKYFLEWRFQLIKEQVKTILTYAYPLMFMGLAGIANEVIDRPMVKRLWPEGMDDIDGVEANGIYGACYKIATLMTLGIQAMRYAVEPFVFSQAKEKNSPETFSRIMIWFVLIACFIFLFLSLNIGWIGDLLIRSKSYKAGLVVVPILLMANLFLGIYINLSLWFKLSDKTQWGTWLAIIGAVITLVGNFLLIPILGYIGSAWTTLACYFTMAVLSYIFGQKYYPIPYRTGKIILYLMVTVLVYLAVDYMALNGLLGYVLNALIPLLVVGGIFYLDKKEFLGTEASS